MRPALPSGTVTFLFTDVEGSTRLLQELGAEGHAEALADHRRVIRDACAAEGGVEVDEARLGERDSTFERSRARGYGLSLEEAVEYVRASLD